ncbi:hypothetical protein [Tabrizicola piscis]|nr:hypothetical protein [Tabrizicola piscis]
MSSAAAFLLPVLVALALASLLARLVLLRFLVLILVCHPAISSVSGG